MEIIPISLQHGLEFCCTNGAKITSAALEFGECIEFIPEKGFFLCGENIGENISAAMKYFQNNQWASKAHWYIQQ